MWLNKTKIRTVTRNADGIIIIHLLDFCFCFVCLLILKQLFLPAFCYRVHAKRSIGTTDKVIFGQKKLFTALIYFFLSLIVLLNWFSLLIPCHLSDGLFQINCWTKLNWQGCSCVQLHFKWLEQVIVFLQLLLLVTWAIYFIFSFCIINRILINLHWSFYTLYISKAFATFCLYLEWR